MKLLILFCVVLVLQRAVFTSAGTINLANSKISILGKAQMKFDSPGGMWAGLSAARRFPIIYSGDLIALRLATTSGSSKWLSCSKTTYCSVTTCPGADYMVAAKWSACPTVVFRVRARGKTDGQPVDSGDHVRITFPYYGETRHLYCSTSTTFQCRATWAISSWTGNRWLYYTQGTFRIFSKNGVDGTPVQLGDIVGFKYPYGSNSAWLYNSGNNFYARSCHIYNKPSCAKENAPTGFQIFKKL